MDWLKTKYSDELYVFFRVFSGVFFFMFGIMKIAGLWGMPGGASAAWSLAWFAGVFEIMIGLSLFFGVLVRLASAFGIIEMIVAYGFVISMSGTWNPLVNQGISALLYVLIFVVTLVYGAHKYSLERLWFKKEFF